MHEVLELVRPFDFIIPNEYAEKLASLNELARTSSDDLNQAQKNLMNGVTFVAETILQNQGPELKTPVKVGNKMVLAPPNCTDSAAAILRVCSSIAMPAYAHFNGSHASVTVPDTIVNGFWKLDRASADLQTGFNNGRFQAMNDAVSNLAGHAGAVVWMTLTNNNEGWRNTYFDGYNIRQEVQDIHAQNYIAGRTSVLVNTPLAFTMLRAIDVLETYRENEMSPQASRDYSMGKTALRHLIPKL